MMTILLSREFVSAICLFIVSFLFFKLGYYIDDHSDPYSPGEFGAMMFLILSFISTIAGIVFLFMTVYYGVISSLPSLIPK